MRVLLFLLFALPSWASATTFNFNGAYDVTFDPSMYMYQQGAYSASGIGQPDDVGPLNPFDNSQMVWLDDNPSPLSNFLLISGTRFSVLGLDIFEFYNRSGSPYLNVQFTGTRDGSIVAQSLYSAAQIAGRFLPSGFTNLDSFEISILRPGFGCDDTGYCTGVQVDNITLAPVPLSAALSFMLLGLGALGLMRVRR